VSESTVASVRQVSREDNAEEQSSGGLPTRVVAARLVRLEDDGPEPLTPAQVVHAVHAVILRSDACYLSGQPLDPANLTKCAVPYQDLQQAAERLKVVHEARVKIVPRV